VSASAPLTASLLEAFALCPMKFHLYRLGGADTGATRRVDAARALHAAAKHALDECYRAGGPRAYPVERLCADFTAAFEGRACADSREEEQQRTTGLRVLTEYHAGHLDDAIEGVRVDVTLEGALGQWNWRAPADRREGRPDGSVAYVRYSTARRPPTPGELAEDLRTGLLQLLAEAAEGRPVEIEVHALRSQRALDATKRPDQLAEIERQLTTSAAAALALDDPAALKGRHCRWCHVRGVCPAWARR